ncbi:Aste57867_4069 [Aphanomyces stellatus]|uniref:Aste57867_4069 protein n=1 Tax=Aphanomyces stellatus TaxID=120398 RepID=A0A485KFB3_9STRA|nr:hypothetical protein As57867_004058 [Aphanomyces stellatus]VFT81203.1 Aste57867_4069 [Aphanomyces stellatus]
MTPTLQTASLLGLLGSSSQGKREKSKLKRFLAWLTVLSLTSFLFHPESMLWAVLHYAARLGHKLLQRTVAMCGWADTESLPLVVAAVAWAVAAVAAALVTSYYVYFLHADKGLLKCSTPKAGAGFDIAFHPPTHHHQRGCKKAKRTAKEDKKKARDLYFSNLLRHAESDDSMPTSDMATSTTTTDELSQQHALPPINDLASSMPVMMLSPPLSPSLHVHTPTSTDPPPSISRPQEDDRPLEQRHDLHVSIGSITTIMEGDEEADDEASPTKDEATISCDWTLLSPLPADGMLTNPVDELSNQATHDYATNSSAVHHADNDDENNSQPRADNAVDATRACLEEGPTPPATPAAFNKAELLAFLCDPKLTSSVIRAHVQGGIIDADMVLAMSTADFGAAKVPQLAVRMLFISVMATKESPQPHPYLQPHQPPTIDTKKHGVAPPPGFSAIASSSSLFKSCNAVVEMGRFKSGAARPRSGHHAAAAAHCDNQYEKEMERISNQMTMNVLD